jgi:hypothetical protein
VNDGPDRLLDEIGHLAHRRRERRTGDHHRTRPDQRRIVGLVEERPHVPGLVFTVQISLDVDPRHRSSSPPA